jgi:hypothetical protein
MSLELLAKQEPKIIQALYRLKSEVFKDGALTTKEKELIATALSCTESDGGWCDKGGAPRGHDRRDVYGGTIHRDLDTEDR